MDKNHPDFESFAEYLNDGKLTIAGPSAFQGEPRWVPYYWSLILDGLCSCNEYEIDGTMYTIVAVEKTEREAFPELASVAEVCLYSRDDGFVCSVVPDKVRRGHIAALATIARDAGEDGHDEENAFFSAVEAFLPEDAWAALQAFMLRATRDERINEALRVVDGGAQRIRATLVFAVEIDGSIARVGEATKVIGAATHLSELIKAAVVGVTGLPPEDVNAHRVAALEPSDEEI